MTAPHNEPDVGFLNNHYFYDINTAMVKSKDQTHGARKAPENPDLWQPIADGVPLKERIAHLEDALKIARLARQANRRKTT